MLRRPWLLLLLSLVAIAAVWMTFVRLAPPPIDAKWIEGIYRKKEAIAAATASPKILLVGGSATHFSFSAAELSTQTGWRAVNLGSHAGLGIEYILYRAKRSIGNGDIVIVALESGALHSLKPTEVLTRYVDHYDLSFIPHAGQNIGRLIFGVSPADVVRTLLANRVPWSSPLYRSETVDQFGDETANVPANVTQYARDQVHGIPPISMAPLGAANKFLQDFTAYSRSVGAKVYFVWTPTVFREQYASQDYQALFRSLGEEYARDGATVLGRPEDFMMDERDMLDTEYHAITHGRSQVTKALAINLCAQITCTPALTGADGHDK